MVVCEGRGRGHPGGPGARTLSGKEMTLPKHPPLSGFGGTHVHPVLGGPWCPSKGTFPIPSAPGAGPVPHGCPPAHQGPFAGVPERLCCILALGCLCSPGGVTLSPVFILLLDENSFRDRVTSLGTGGGRSHQCGGTDPRGRWGAQTHPRGAGAAARRRGDTHWDTSAMCLWRRETQRSSSSSRRTSLTRASPMPLVSYLGRGQERGGGHGAHGHTWLGGDRGAGGGCSRLCQRRGEVISQFDFTSHHLLPIYRLGRGLEKAFASALCWANIAPARLQLGTGSPRGQVTTGAALTCRRRSRWAAGRSSWPGRSARAAPGKRGRSRGPG